MRGVRYRPNSGLEMGENEVLVENIVGGEEQIDVASSHFYMYVCMYAYLSGSYVSDHITPHHIMSNPTRKDSAHTW